MESCGVSDYQSTIISHDNCMSIDPNCGCLKDYLTDITTSPLINKKSKMEVWKILGKNSASWAVAPRSYFQSRRRIKSALLNQSNLFESWNLRYFGPVDGTRMFKSFAKFWKDLKGYSWSQNPSLRHCKRVRGTHLRKREIKTYLARSRNFDK